RARAGGVDPLGAQALDRRRRRGLLEAQRDQRARLAEVTGDARHQRMEGGRAGKPEPEPAGFAACGAAGGKHSVFGALEHDPRFREKGFARRGQLDAAWLPPEQLEFELGFEGANLLAERRLLDAEPRCRASHMTFLCDGNEIPEMAQFHTHDVSLTALSYIRQTPGHRLFFDPWRAKQNS